MRVRCVCMWEIELAVRKEDLSETNDGEMKRNIMEAELIEYAKRSSMSKVEHVGMLSPWPWSRHIQP